MVWFFESLIEDSSHSAPAPPAVGGRRSAVGAQKSASVYLGAHRSLHSGLGRSCKPISADLRASRFPRIEATIEHARTVLHQSLCFSCAARLPFVGHARSAHIRSCLVIEARARRFSSAA